MLSVTDGCQWRCGDGIIVPQRVIDYVTGHLPAGSITMRYTTVTRQGLERARQAIEAAMQAAVAQSAGPATLALPRPS